MWISCLGEQKGGELEDGKRRRRCGPMSKVAYGCGYISDVEISRVAQPAPLGIGEAEGLHDPVVGQRLLLGRGDAGVGEVVAC